MTTYLYQDNLDKDVYYEVVFSSCPEDTPDMFEFMSQSKDWLFIGELSLESDALH